MGKIGIIIQREFNQRVRKKSFIITTIITPLLFIGMFAVMGVFMTMNFSDTKEVMVVDNTGIIAPRLESNKRIEYQPSELTFEQIKEQKSDGGLENLYGILVIGPDVMDNPRNVQLYTYGTSTMDVEMEMAGQIGDVIEAEKLKRYDIENLPQILEEVKTNVSLKSYSIEVSGAEKESSSGIAMAASYIFGILIYMFIFLYGAMVMQGVIEEKSSKVIEIMVSSVRPFQLMMGKILGIACVALTQFFIWVVFFFVAASAVGAFLTPDIVAEASAGLSDGSMGDMVAMSGMNNIDPEIMSAIDAAKDPAFLLRLLGGFLIYFIGGYLIYAAMFAAVGSAVSNEADAQQLQLPITIPLLLAFMLMFNVMRDPNSSLAVWASIIPFTSPVIMVARLPYGVPGWEFIASIVLLVATFIFLVWFAGKIYRVGIFMTGKKPTFKELWKWSRYKY